MATGTALSTLVTMLKGEIGASTTIGTGTDAELKVLLSNKQKFLAALRDWDNLRLQATVGLLAGVRYATKPSINFNRPFKVEAKINDFWSQVAYGIGADELNIYDSEVLETADPIQAWQHYGLTQFEVWPVPATAQNIRFIGQMNLGALVVDADTCTLDDLMLVLFTAADILADANSPGAQRKAANAQTLAASLVSGTVRRQPSWSLIPREQDRLRGPTYVGGGGSGSGTVVTSYSSSYAIGSGVSSGTVSYASFGSTPASVVLTVRAPAGGLNLFASVVAGSVTATSFDFALSADTDAATYMLDYSISS